LFWGFPFVLCLFFEEIVSCGCSLLILSWVKEAGGRDLYKQTDGQWKVPEREPVIFFIFLFLLLFISLCEPQCCFVTVQAELTWRLHNSSSFFVRAYLLFNQAL
jgi:hypothetical protein